ncbi:hypothetical protein AB0K16_21450 [Nonomuraea jabiensis]|uniref:hypothetical protein n=1 Tax=Nonomuraea jabiensis TaxID=882448 RepID=UPI00341D2F99
MRLPVALGALAVAALVGAGAVVVPQLGRAPAAVAAAPSATAAAGRFATLPRACGLLTPEQAAQAVPKALIMPRENAECTWHQSLAKAVGTTAAPPAAASGTGPAAAPVPDDLPPFTKPLKPCTLVSDDLVRELTPSAGEPFTYVKGAFTSCSWKSDYAVPEAKRGELSITLDTLDSAAMSDATFDLSKRVASRLHTNYLEVDGLAHDAFTYTDTATRGLRRYKVTYEFRLSNLQGTVEYGRSVGVDPDGSIAGNAGKVTRLVIDRLLKRPG